MNLSLFFLYCSPDKKTEPQPGGEESESKVLLTEEQLKNTNIITGKLVEGAITTTLKLSGIIEVPPQNLISVSVPLGGYLQSTHLLEGMKVKKGDVIAIMEDPHYIQIQQDYLIAKIRYRTLEQELSRQRELNEFKAGSDKVFENAQADFLTQKILMKALAEKLKLIGMNPDKVSENNISRRISILSPINGYVARVKENIGKYVMPENVLFDLVDPTDIHLSLTVFEKDINQLAVGQNLVSFTNSQPEVRHRAKIILMGRDMTKDRAIIVHCHFEEYDASLISGMYMNAEVETGKRTGYLIPETGMVRFEGKHYIFEVRADRNYEKVEVVPEISKNGSSLITLADGSNPKERIFVLQDAYTLLMKMKNMEED
jgi:cobalt-zinc-cadmium efflux system membrane fusion protein